MNATSTRKKWMVIEEAISSQYIIRYFISLLRSSSWFGSRSRVKLEPGPLWHCVSYRWNFFLLNFKEAASVISSTDQKCICDKLINTYETLVGRLYVQLSRMLHLVVGWKKNTTMFLFHLVDSCKKLNVNTLVVRERIISGMSKVNMPKLRITWWMLTCSGNHHFILSTSFPFPNRNEE